MPQTPLQYMTDPRFYQRPDPPDEPDEDEPEVELDPTEYECNTCGWRGQTPSRPACLGIEERRFYPSCVKWTEAEEEWNVVSADPFEFPMLETATSVADLQSIPVRKEVEAAVQLNLFEGVG